MFRTSLLSGVIASLTIAVGIAVAGPQLTRAQGQPVLILNPPVAREAQVTATGRGFCASPSCSDVTIAIDERVAASSVGVNGQGEFEATLTVSEPPGEYTVTALQTGANGSSIVAQAQLSVPPEDLTTITELPTVNRPTATDTPRPLAATPSVPPGATAPPTSGFTPGSSETVEQPLRTGTPLPPATATAVAKTATAAAALTSTTGSGGSGDDGDGSRGSATLWVVLAILGGLAAAGLLAAFVWQRRRG